MTLEKNRAQFATPKKNILFAQNIVRKHPAKRTFVVAGVERGGTSMVAGVCRALGVNFGDKAGLNHEDPAFLTENKSQLEQAIKLRNKKCDVWGFKVPKASLHLDFYEKNLRYPFYIFVYRNPIAIIDSWIQRGAGNPAEVLQRIQEYQNAQLKHITSTRRPYMLVNYERVVSNQENREDFIKLLANFLGINLTVKSIETASQMITGDGKGYVNLAEEFFYMHRIAKIPNRPEIAQKTEIHANCSERGFLRYRSSAPGQIFHMESHANLPKKFFLRIDLETTDIKNFDNHPIRIFFNFSGKRHPGHCARPVISHGENNYYVETSGNAKDLSIGVIDPPKNLKANVIFFRALSTDTIDVEAVTLQKHIVSENSFLKKIIKTLKS